MAAVAGRRYRIGEVAKELGVNQVTLRYWEDEFALRPLRSKSGQRIYTKVMVNRLARIRDLLYVQRYTIEGARLALRTTDASMQAIQIGGHRKLWMVPTRSGLEMHGIDDTGAYHSPSRQVYEEHILPALQELEELTAKRAQ